MIKKIIIAVMLCVFTYGNTQQNINHYKYVVVPLQFDFVKGKDTYRINTLTRHLFKQNGYTAYFDEQELPQDLFQNRCLGMYADVKRIKGGFLRIQLQIELRDCKGNLIMASKIGKTKEKSFEKAYKIAIREAFETFENINHKYDPTGLQHETNAITNTEDLKIVEEESKEAKAKIQRLEKEIETLKQQQQKEKVEVVAEKKQEAKKRALPSDVKSEKVIEKTKVDYLYAQPIANGYQLVDTAPKKVMVILKTSAKDVFVVKGLDAIVFKRNGVWIYSENKAGKLTEKSLNIKF